MKARETRAGKRKGVVEFQLKYLIAIILLMLFIFIGAYLMMYVKDFKLF